MASKCLTKPLVLSSMRLVGTVGYVPFCLCCHTEWLSCFVPSCCLFSFLLLFLLCWTTQSNERGGGQAPCSLGAQCHLSFPRRADDGETAGFTASLVKIDVYSFQDGQKVKTSLSSPVGQD